MFESCQAFRFSLVLFHFIIFFELLNLGVIKIRSLGKLSYAGRFPIKDFIALHYNKVCEKHSSKTLTDPYSKL